MPKTTVVCEHPTDTDSMGSDFGLCQLCWEKYCSEQWWEMMAQIEEIEDGHLDDEDFYLSFDEEDKTCVNENEMEDCAWDPETGICGYAGSEHCDFECPFRDWHQRDYKKPINRIRRFLVNLIAAIRGGSDA